MSKWTDIATVVIAVFALIVSLLSYLNANKSNEIASSALQETQKFNRFSLEPELDIKIKPRAIIIRNVGKGVAIIKKLAFTKDNKTFCHDSSSLTQAIGGDLEYVYEFELYKERMIRGEGGELKIINCDTCKFERNIPHSSLNYHIEYYGTYSNKIKFYNPTDAFKELECK